MHSPWGSCPCNLLRLFSGLHFALHAMMQKSSPAALCTSNSTPALQPSLLHSRSLLKTLHMAFPFSLHPLLMSVAVLDLCRASCCTGQAPCVQSSSRARFFGGEEVLTISSGAAKSSVLLVLNCKAGLPAFLRGSHLEKLGERQRRNAGDRCDLVLNTLPERLLHAYF